MRLTIANMGELVIQKPLFGIECTSLKAKLSERSNQFLQLVLILLVLFGSCHGLEQHNHLAHGVSIPQPLTSNSTTMYFGLVFFGRLLIAVTDIQSSTVEGTCTNSEENRNNSSTSMN